MASLIHLREQLLDGHDQRRVADDAELAVDHRGELVQGLEAVPGAGLGDVCGVRAAMRLSALDPVLPAVA